MGRLLAYILDGESRCFIHAFYLFSYARGLCIKGPMHEHMLVVTKTESRKRVKVASFAQGESLFADMIMGGYVETFGEIS